MPSFASSENNSPHHVIQLPLLSALLPFSAYTFLKKNFYSSAYAFVAIPQGDLLVSDHRQKVQIFSFCTNNIHHDTHMSNALHRKTIVSLSRFLPCLKAVKEYCSGKATVLLCLLLQVCFLTFCTNSLCFKLVSNWRSCDRNSKIFFDFSDRIRHIFRRIFIKISF